MNEHTLQEKSTLNNIERDEVNILKFDDTLLVIIFKFIYKNLSYMFTLA